MEDDRIEGLRMALVCLKDYHEKHKMGVNAVIQSQWARGVSCGRQESENVLAEKIAQIQGSK